MTTTVSESKNEVNGLEYLSEVLGEEVSSINNVLSVGFDVNVKKLLKEVIKSYNSGLEPIREFFQNSLDASATYTAIKRFVEKVNKWRSEKVTYFIDNGKGMDVKKLQAFIGFGLSQKDLEDGMRGSKGIGASFVYLARQSIIYTRKNGQTLIAYVRESDINGETEPIIVKSNKTLKELVGIEIDDDMESGTIIQTFDLSTFNNTTLSSRRLKNYITQETHVGSYDTLIDPNWNFPLVELQVKGEKEVFRGYKRIFSEDFEVGFNNRHPENKINMDGIKSHKELSSMIQTVINQGYKFKMLEKKLDDNLYTKKGKSYIMVLIGEGYILPKPMRIKPLDKKSTSFEQSGKRFADTKQTSRGFYVGVNGLPVEKIGKNASANTNDQENDYTIVFANIDFLELTLNRNQITEKESPHMVEVFEGVQREVYALIETIKEFRSLLYAKEKNSEDILSLLEKERSRIHNLEVLSRNKVADERIQKQRDLRRNENYEFLVRELIHEFAGRVDLGMDFYMVGNMDSKQCNLDSLIAKDRYLEFDEISNRYVCPENKQETLEIEYFLSNFKIHDHSIKIAQNVACYDLGNWSVGETKKMTTYELTLLEDNEGYYIEANLKDMLSTIRVYVFKDILEKEKFLQLA